MKVVLLAGLAILAAISAGVFFNQIKRGPTPVPAEIISKYTAWKKEYGKLYATPAENDYRLRIFMARVSMIDRMNEEYNHLHKMKGGDKLSGNMYSLQPYADATDDEIRARRPGYSRVDEVKRTSPTSGLGQSAAYVQKVRSQDGCSASYAFAAIQSLEKHYYMVKKSQVDLSVQEIIDCSTMDNGCGGGSMLNAINYVKTNGIGIASNYPYIAARSSCRADRLKRVFFGSTIQAKERDFSIANVKTLVAADIIPGVMIYATGKFSWVSSTDDVYDASLSGECNYDPDHFVSVTAAGTDNVTVLNSWGTAWGVSGYKKVKPCSANALLGTAASLAYSLNTV